MVLDKNRNVQSWGSFWLGKWRKFNFRHAKVAKSCQVMAAVGNTVLELKGVAWQMDIEKCYSKLCMLTNHSGGYKQKRKESKEKISKIGRGGLVREDQNSKRSYTVSVLDSIAGKGAELPRLLAGICRGMAAGIYVPWVRGQGIEISQFGWKVYVVLWKVEVKVGRKVGDQFTASSEILLEIILFCTAYILKLFL